MRRSDLEPFMDEGETANAFEDAGGCHAEEPYICCQEDSPIYSQPERWCPMCRIWAHVQQLQADLSHARDALAARTRELESLRERADADSEAVRLLAQLVNNLYWHASIGCDYTGKYEVELSRVRPGESEVTRAKASTLSAAILAALSAAKAKEAGR